MKIRTNPVGHCKSLTPVWGWKINVPSCMLQVESASTCEKLHTCPHGTSCSQNAITLEMWCKIIFRHVSKEYVKLK